MKVGVLGSGDVGRTLASGFLSSGHQVMLAARDRSNEKIVAWQKENAGGQIGTFADAARFGEMIVLATLGEGTEEAIRIAGAENFDGKVVIDTTNPLDFSAGFPPKLAINGNDSLGEHVQRAIPKAKVVKCFNTVGNGMMVKPDVAGGPPTMFICGNDAGAKAEVSKLLVDWKWEPSDIGGIECSRYLEALCLVWVLDAARGNTWMQAFKMLRKS